MEPAPGDGKRGSTPWLLVWVAAVAGGGILAARGLEVRNPSTHWEPGRPAPATQLWSFARTQFGDHDVVLLGLQLAADVGLEALAPFERWVGDQPEVASRFGPAIVRDLYADPMTRRRLGRQLAELASAVYRPDARFALVYASLHAPPVRDDLGLKTAFLDRVDSVGVAMLPPGTALFVAGKPPADVALNRLLRQDALGSAPRAFLVLTLVLGLLLRRRVFGPLAGAVAAVVLVAGGLALFRTPVSTATVVTFPLTLVIGLAYGIHVEAALARSGSLRAARRQLAAPLTWAWVTTAAGILTFAVSPIPGLRVYAYAATAGLAVSYLAAFTLAPHVALAAPHAARTGSLWRGVPVRVFAAAARRPGTVTVIWVLAVAATIGGLARVRVEPNNYLGFFPSGHPTLVAHQVLDSVFGGSLPIYVLAEASAGDAYGNPDVRRRVRAFVREAQADPRVGPAFTPFTAEGRAAETLEDWFRGREARYTRAVLSVPLLPTATLRDLLQSLDSLAAAQSDPTLRLRITGPLPAGLPLLESLVESQAQSLLGVLLAVAVAVLVAARPWRRGLLLLAPNLLPPLAVAAAMGYLGIPIDFGTVVVISMVIGIAVDDTLQIAWASSSSSPAHAVRRVAAPITVTSLAAVAGFASFFFSPFPVTQRLGLLTALGIGVAWIADFTLTPLLLARYRARRGSR